MIKRIAPRTEWDLPLVKGRTSDLASLKTTNWTRSLWYKIYLPIYQSILDWDGVKCFRTVVERHLNMFFLFECQIYEFDKNTYSLRTTITEASKLRTTKFIIFKKIYNLSLVVFLTKRMILPVLVFSLVVFYFELEGQTAYTLRSLHNICLCLGYIILQK